MATEPKAEKLVEQKVTYILFKEGKFYLIENVPARVNQETGEQFFAPQTVEHLRQIILGERQPMHATPDFIHLTEREKQILQLVGQGAHNMEIAQKLGISEKTVRNRLSVIFDKLHINNRTQAALFAVREGLSSKKTDT